MMRSKLIQTTMPEEGVISASFRLPWQDDRNRKVISIIGKCSRGKSTLLNQIVGQAAPFFVHSDLDESFQPTTEGIDFYDDGNSISLDSEGVGTVNNEDNDIDLMILLSTTSISNVIILIAEHHDITDSGSFCRNSLKNMFISNINNQNSKKKLIFVIRGAPNTSRAIERFEQFINDIWNLACRNYLETHREAREEEKKEERDLEYPLENYFELKVLRVGEFLEDFRIYENSFIQTIRTEIRNWNEDMELSAVEERLNEIVTNFNENTLIDPETVQQISSILENSLDSIRRNCLSKDPAIVCEDINQFIEREKESTKTHLLYNHQLNRKGKILLDFKLNEIYQDLSFEWMKMLLNYTRAQIKYYQFKINCVNLNFETNKEYIYIERILEYKDALRIEVENFDITQELKQKLMARSSQFEVKIKKEIFDSIKSNKMIKYTTIGIGLITAIATAGLGSVAFFVEAALARIIGGWAIGFFIASGASWLGAIINEITFNSRDQTHNLTLDQQNLLIEEVNQLGSEMEELLTQLKECKGSKLLLKIDRKIMQENSNEFSTIDLETNFAESNPN